MRGKPTNLNYGSTIDILKHTGTEWKSNAQKHFKQFSIVITVLIIVTAFLSLIGWEFDINLFKYPLPGVLALNPISAISWIFIGISFSLYLSSPTDIRLKIVSRFFSATVILIGIIRLLEIKITFLADFDQILFADKLKEDIINERANHMSIATAFCLLLIGMALLLTSFKKRRIKYFANYPALIVFIVGLFSIIGHAYYVSEFYGLLQRYSMSGYTAGCFILISLAVMFANSDVGFMRTFSSSFLGGKMSRLLIPSAILIPLFLGFLRVLMSWEFSIHTELGASIFVISIIITFCVLIWYFSKILNRSDIARTNAEADLVKLNDGLEQMVIDRTEEINKREKRFRAMVEKNDAIIALLDSDLKTIYRTPASFRITGWTDEERMSVNALELIHDDDIVMVKAILQQAMKTPGQPVNLTIRFKDSVKRYIWMEGSITNMLNDPSVGAIVANLRDITDRKEAEQQIATLNDELELKVIERTSELQNAIKDIESFSYTVSHDLRTPLQIINTYSSILAKKHCAYSDEDAQNILGEIKEYTRQMSEVIESLLNLSLSGRIEMVNTQVNMNDIVQKVIAELQIINKNSHTETIVSPLHSAFCDEGLIKLVWLNLISNAMKYSAKVEHPKVEIGSEEINGENIYYVKDNGVGFSMENAEKLFLVFQRLPSSSDFEGTGLGLAIVHRIITRHGGRVWAKAEENKGATFYFTLPFKVSDFN